MKKALNIVKSVLVWLVVIFAVCMMIFTVVSVSTFDRSDRSIFGYKAFTVLSDSMSKTHFDAGDVVLVKEVEPQSLEVGDVIAYTSTNTENYGETVTHMIREKTADADGNPGFITYGTTTDTNDEKIVTYDYIIGKYQGKLPKVGKFFEFLKTTQGYIICILIPFLILIIIQGLNSIRLFRRYKQEQLSELEDERRAIEAERAESKRLMEELQSLKAQLGNRTETEETTPDD